MTWGPGAPAKPTPHTNITVPFYQENIQSPLLHLRNLVPDPVAVDRVLLSTAIGGTPTAAFGQVPAAALAAGVAAENLGYTPANKAGDTFTGPITVPSYLTVLQINDSGAGGRFRLKGGAAGFYDDIDQEVTAGVWRLFGTNNVSNIMTFTPSTGNLGLPNGLTAVSALLTGALTAASATLSGALSAASASLTGALSAASVSLTGNATAARFVSTVSDGSTPPMSVHANQAAVAVPNLKAAKATDADTVGGNLPAAFATAGHTHTIPQIATGTYSGSGSTGTSKTVNTLTFAPSLVIVTTVTAGVTKAAVINAASVAVVVPQGATATSSVSGTLTANGWTLNALFNQTGESYAFWAIG